MNKNITVTTPQTANSVNVAEWHDLHYISTNWDFIVGLIAAIIVFQNLNEFNCRQIFKHIYITEINCRNAQFNCRTIFYVKFGMSSTVDLFLCFNLTDFNCRMFSLFWFYWVQLSVNLIHIFLYRVQLSGRRV